MSKFNFKNSEVQYIELVFSNKENTKVIKIPESGIIILESDINKEKIDKQHFYTGTNFKLVYKINVIENNNSKEKVELLLNNYSEYNLLGIDVHKKDKSFFSISISKNKMLTLSQKENVNFIFSGTESEYKSFLNTI